MMEASEIELMRGVASLTFLMVRTEPPKIGEVKTYRFHEDMLNAVSFRLYPGEITRFALRDYDVTFNRDETGTWTVKVHQQQDI